MAAPVTIDHATGRKVVKKVLSGDQIIFVDLSEPVTDTPKEVVFSFANVTAPKIYRHLKDKGVTIPEEPYGWEAREFLRKKLVGQTIDVKVENEAPLRGVAFLKDSKENITELLVSEGYVKVRDNCRDIKLKELQEQAKAAKKNIWNPENEAKHIRSPAGPVANLEQFVKKYANTPLDALIEVVLDGHRMVVVLLPEYWEVRINLTGIHVEAYEKEAKWFIESRLLQRDVKVILEGVTNKTVYGSVIHPNGNIAEVLLKVGYAKCHDSSMKYAASSNALRAAENQARQEKKKIWENAKPINNENKKEYQATVVEVVGGDSLNIKKDDKIVRIFLSSIIPPRDPQAVKSEDGPPRRSKKSVHEIPSLFEAREYLRKKLIGKKVNVIEEYSQSLPNDTENRIPKLMCTVKVGGVNVAEALLERGLAILRKPRDGDDCSFEYSKLNAAVDKAVKSEKGVHSKKEIAPHRITDISSDNTRALTYLSSFQRHGRVDAIVEYVASGSRLKLYVPKESCITVFLLAGVRCPRGAIGKEDPFEAAAREFTKNLVMQREVEVTVDGVDKRNNMVGWLWVDGLNLSVAIVKAGFGEIHFSAEKSEHYRALVEAEEYAKSQRLGIWVNAKETPVEEKVDENTSTERNVNYHNVVITEIAQDLKFFAQNVEQGPKLEELMTQIRQEFQTNPPLPGAYTARKGDECAAKFVDDEWYRARVERIQGTQVHIFYTDYGNREITSSARCAALPTAFRTEQKRPFVSEYRLAFVKLPKDPEDQDAAVRAFKDDTQDVTLSLNVEYTIEKMQHVTLVESGTKVDIGKNLVSEAFLLVDVRREARLKKIVAEYKSAQEDAKKAHKGIWQYGDITEDDAKEFG